MIRPPHNTDDSLPIDDREEAGDDKRPTPGGAQAKPWESLIAEAAETIGSNDGSLPDRPELGDEADPALLAKFNQGSRDGQRDRRDG